MRVSYIVGLAASAVRIRPRCVGAFWAGESSRRLCDRDGLSAVRRDGATIDSKDSPSGVVNLGGQTDTGQQPVREKERSIMLVWRRIVLMLAFVLVVAACDDSTLSEGDDVAFNPPDEAVTVNEPTTTMSDTTQAGGEVEVVSAPDAVVESVQRGTMDGEQLEFNAVVNATEDGVFGSYEFAALAAAEAPWVKTWVGPKTGAVIWIIEHFIRNVG